MSRQPRRADLADLDAFETLEKSCFSVDAQSRRSLRWLLGRANSAVFVIPEGTVFRAGLILLYRRNSRVARVYSIAVLASARGQGLGRRLLDAAVVDAKARDCRMLRAEVRQSNQASLALLTARGFRVTGALPDYYPDGESGWRLQHSL